MSLTGHQDWERHDEHWIGRRGGGAGLKSCTGFFWRVARWAEAGKRGVEGAPGVGDS